MGSSDHVWSWWYSLHQSLRMVLVNHSLNTRGVPNALLPISADAPFVMLRKGSQNPRFEWPKLGACRMFGQTQASNRCLQYTIMMSPLLISTNYPKSFPASSPSTPRIAATEPLLASHSCVSTWAHRTSWYSAWDREISWLVCVSEMVPVMKSVNTENEW